MSFSDDDLGKLKGFVTIDDFYKAEGSRYMRPLIKGLIARLEAAEALIMIEPAHPLFEPLYKTWINTKKKDKL